MKSGTTFKGAPKPFGASGHFDEPRRHSLQAKGFKTGHFNESNRHALQAHGIRTGHPAEQPQLKKVPKPELTEEELMHQEIAKGLDIEDNFRGVEFEDEDNHYIVKSGDHEWLVFNSEEDAEAFAKERVEEDLENEPEIFQQDWLQGHIDLESLKNALEDDVSEFQQSYYNDIESESDKDWQNRCVGELIQMGKLDEDDFKGEDGELKDITPELQEKIDDAIEEAVQEYTDEQMDDPINYLEEIYPKDEAMKKAIELGGIDYDEASQDAIDTDGVAHFLASYDGEEIELPNGRVAYRTN